MAYDFYLGVDEDDASRQQPVYSLSEIQHKQLFAADLSEFEYLSLMDSYFSDSEFIGEDLQGVIADIEQAKTAINNSALIRILEQFHAICLDAQAQQLGVFGLCD